MEFPTTQWSQLALATLHGDSQARVALGEFYLRYREPVAQFIRARGVPSPAADDLTQDFFVHVLEKSTLRRADASRGRFRSFLLGALARFLADAQDYERAAKRGSGETPLSLDAPLGEFEPVIAAATSLQFDRDWAHQLIALALQRLEADYAKRGLSVEFAVLRAYMPGSIATPAYDAAAAQLEISVPALKTHVHRLRERFRACLREELAATVNSPSEIDAELAYLGQVLQAQANAPASPGRA